ncbi:MAG: AtpZ/AtpI family protein [Nitrospinota bacterium]
MLDGVSEEKKSIFRNLYNLTTIGLQIVVSIFIGLGIGLMLDDTFETKPIFLFIFLLMGIGAGFLNLFRVVKKEVGEQKKDEDAK